MKTINKSRLFNLFISKTSFISLIIAALFLSFVSVSCEKDDDEPQTEEETTTETDDGTNQNQGAFEPNDSWSDAYPINLDTTYHAEISSSSDLDYFSFNTKHPSTTYDIISFQFTNVDQNMKISMEILDQNGSSLITAGSNTAGANYTYHLTCPGGAYILKVTGNDGFTSYTGAYALKITNLDTNDIYAPNHTIETAAEAQLDSSINGRILSAAGESDFYVFTNADTSYWKQFQLSFSNVSSEYQVHYEVFDTDYNSIIDGSENKGVNFSKNFNTKSHKIFVKVHGQDYYGDTKGSYTMKLSVSNNNDDNEPDDNFASARIIDTFPSGNISGTIIEDAANNNNGDYEFFKVTLHNDKKVSFSVDPEASNTEMHFTIYDTGKAYFDNMDGGNGQTLNYSLNNASGSDTYFYIKLGSYTGDNGNYTISFTEGPATK